MAAKPRRSGSWFSVQPVFVLAVLLLVVFLPEVGSAYSQAGPTCDDSDGGLVFDIAGHVEGVGSSGHPYRRDDVCLTGNLEGSLKEFYCSDSTPLAKMHICINGCLDGVCLPVVCTDLDGDGYSVEGSDCGPVDCDDTNPAVHPGAAEMCDNGVDDNCDGLTDAADPACIPCVDSDGGLVYDIAGYLSGTGPGGSPYRRDDVCLTGDLNGWLKEYWCSGATPLAKQYSCPTGCLDGACLPLACADLDGDGYSVEGGDCGPVDCDDTNPAVRPGAAEMCDNGVDDDCNGLIDGEDPACLVCTDLDGDGYSVEGGDCGPVDCDDTNPAVHPGAAEVCDDGVDDNCDGLIDGDDPTCNPCTDSDAGLTYTLPGTVTVTSPQGYVTYGLDECETGAYEGYVKEYVCNGDTMWNLRQLCPFNCGGGACLLAPGCTDGDGDWYAVEGEICGAVDCDDTNAAVHPGMPEVCDNGMDDDCSGLADASDPACNPCSDSDGGLNYFHLGWTTDLSGTVHSDKCSGTAGTLLEYSCDAAGHAQPATYVCPSTCLDGACQAKNVIILGWDGVQRDHLMDCYNGVLPECTGGLPNLQTLSGGLLRGNVVTNAGTATKPGWVQILSGYNAEVTGVWDNSIYQPLPEGYSLFEKVESHYGADAVVTMFVSGKDQHTGGACIGDATLRDGEVIIEDKGQPWCITKDHLDYYENELRYNPLVGNRALDLIDAHRHDLFVAFFLFRDPDVTGHVAGENSSLYTTRLFELDTWLGQIVARLDTLGLSDRTLVYVTTDHGFDEGSRWHNNSPFGFLASNDPLIVRMADRKDLAPTILERYGVSRGPVGPAPAVDGFSLYSIPPLACIPAGSAHLDYAGAPLCCAGLDLISMDIRLGMQCIPATGGTGDNSGYCTDCGNDICTKPENPCNCPADCPWPG